MSPPSFSGFSFSTLAIRRHIGTFVLTLAVMVLGVYALFGLQVDLLPAITYPRIGVRLEVPGVSPEIAVEEVAKPLEEALGRTEGVMQIYSQTREGLVSLDLYFRPGGNINQALNDATAAFNRARNSLPDIIEQPRIFKIDPSQLPVYELALTSTSLTGQDLRVFAEEELDRELSVVPGVAGVDIAGGAAEEVRVVVDLPRLQALGVGLTTVLQELRDRNQDISGGRILGARSEPLTRTMGKFRQASEIADVSFPVTPANSTNSPTTATGSPTTGAVAPQRAYLRDFAQVIDGSEEQRLFVYLNGKPAVRASILKQPEANTVEVVDAVRKRLAELKRDRLIPADLKIAPILDESRFIRSSLASVTSSAIQGALLAAGVVFVFLGSLRKTLIISLTIPLCALASAIAMKFAGFSLNIFSLAGLAVSVGMVVDASIVILESIDKGLERRLHSPEESDLVNTSTDELVASSSRELESALVASTTTNLASVVPFILIGGFTSLLFNELIWTICFAFIGALVAALTIVPALAAKLLTIPWSSGLNRRGPLHWFNRQFTSVTHQYSRTLAWVLQGRWLFVALLVFSLGSSTWWLAGQIPQELLPRINTGQVSLIALFPPGTSLATNQKVMAAVDKILRKQPQTDSAFLTVGGSFFGTSTTGNPLRSNGTITLKPDSDIDAFITQTNKEIRKLSLAGIRVRLSRGQVRGIILNNSPVRADLDVILRGNSPRLLAQTGRQILEALEDQVSLASFRPDADARQPEVQIRPDWERVSELGLNAREIGETVQTAIQGFVPTQLQRGERLVDVRVQLAAQDRQNPSQLAQIPLFADGRQPVRLGDVAQIEMGEAPGDIQRINQQQVFILVGNLNEGANLSTALKQVEQVIAQVQLPPGISILPSATATSSREVQQSLIILGLLATFLVFVVLALQYNSLIDPLIIMLTVPLALTGGLMGLYVTQTAIGATVIVGAVILVGIVVNNAIIMVELANEIEQTQRCGRAKAILQAAPNRLRPILMTTITTVLGIFPLALGLGEGSEFLKPLGVVVFWGLSLATLLTLFLIPCLYVILHGWQRPLTGSPPPTYSLATTDNPSTINEGVK